MMIFDFTYDIRNLRLSHKLNISLQRHRFPSKYEFGHVNPRYVRSITSSRRRGLLDCACSLPHPVVAMHHHSGDASQSSFLIATRYISPSIFA